MPTAGRDNSRGAVPPAGRVSTSRQWQQLAGAAPGGRVNGPGGSNPGAMPTAGMANGLQWQHRQWGNDAEMRPVDGERTIAARMARPTESVAAPAGSGLRLEWSTERLAGSAVRPTPGRVSTSRVRYQQGAGLQLEWSTQRLAGSAPAGPAAQPPVKPITPDILIPARVTTGSKLPPVRPVPPVRLVQPVPPPLRPARPVPTNILVAAPFRRVSLPPRPVPGHSGSYANPSTPAVVAPSTVSQTF